MVNKVLCNFFQKKLQINVVIVKYIFTFAPAFEVSGRYLNDKG